jgi:hypothetical protein
VFYSFLFFHWFVVEFQHGIKAWLLLKEEKLGLHIIVVHKKALEFNYMQV